MSRSPPKLLTSTTWKIGIQPLITGGMARSKAARPGSCAESSQASGVVAPSVSVGDARDDGRRPSSGTTSVVLRRETRGEEADGVVPKKSGWCGTSSVIGNDDEDASVRQEVTQC
jgi:hypothetical protein